MLIDITHPLTLTTQPFPGDPGLELVPVCTLNKDGVRVSELRLSAHLGTHLDAPAHFLTEGGDAGNVALAACLGPVCCLEATHQEIGTALLNPYEEFIRANQRILFRTGWDRYWGSSDYFQEFPTLTEQALTLLLEWGVRLIGTDTPGIDRAPYALHRRALTAGVVLLENLTRLKQIPLTGARLIALPLPISGLEASPVRAVCEVSLQEANVRGTGSP